MNANDTFGTTSGFADRTGKAVEAAGQFTKHAMEEVREEAGEVLDRGATCARNNLLSGIATAFVGGLIIGLALSRRDRHSFRRDYLEEPLSHAQEAALALLAPLAKAVREQYGHAQSAAHEAADRISDLELDAKPLLKTGRQLGKRLRFW